MWYMAVIPTKHKALSLQEKLNVIWEMEWTPNVTRAELAEELNMSITTLNGTTAKKKALFTWMGDVLTNVKRSIVGK
jgi:hypothetical protein